MCASIATMKRPQRRAYQLWRGEQTAVAVNREADRQEWERRLW
jgi:hypothetical protein